MPITKSAKKALRQSEKRHKFNLRRKVKFKDTVKEFKKAVIAKDFDKAKILLPKVYKTLDKAAKNNTISKNTASRKKSRLSRALSRATAVVL